MNTLQADRKSDTPLRAVSQIRFDLTIAEVAEIKEHVIVPLLVRGDTVADILHHDAPLVARSLPLRLQQFLFDFKYKETAGACVIGGWPVDDAAAGPTPMYWTLEPGPSPVLDHEVYLALLASLLGDVFSWSTVQNGRYVQDLLPVPGQEHEQSAGSSSSLLELHSEDAFSTLRCDYLGLMCMRNDDLIGTSYASLDGLVLSAEHRRVLGEPRFLVRPDDEHIKRAAARGETPPPAMNTPVLFGSEDSPYLVVDECYMETDPDDTEAAEALTALVDQLKAQQTELTLAPGEAAFIDNYRAVHGRKPFRARYDGRDRWLKRVSVTRDLRRSRAARAGLSSYVIASSRA